MQTARCALQGMGSLAKQSGKRFYLVKEVARSQKLPASFLAKMFQKLTHSGLLISRRGPAGGYRLAKPSHRICLMEIVEAVEDRSIRGRPCILTERGCGSDRPCAVHEELAKAERRVREILIKTTLADIIGG